MSDTTPFRTRRRPARDAGTCMVRECVTRPDQYGRVTGEVLEFSLGSFQARLCMQCAMALAAELTWVTKQ